MRGLVVLPVLYGGIFTQLASAGPDMECQGSSQVEIATCVGKALDAVDGAVEIALGFAMASARELDDVTGRAHAVPALEAGQLAWSAYRNAHCDFVGSTYGGGSGTGIAINSCRVVLGRERVDILLGFAR